MATAKYSRQREMILNFLKSRKDHPTAEFIYQNLRTDNPTLSLGTVYRNLTKLSDSGIILKISCNDSSDHFDGNIMPHGHFICNQCKHISDLTTTTFDIDSILQENNFNGKIENSQIIFYGTCAECISKNSVNT